MNDKYHLEPVTIVDNRTTLPPVRDQGSRPLCLAFAASDWNSYKNNISDALSVEYLAYHAYLENGETDFKKGLTFHCVRESIQNHGQPYEHALPYDPNGIRPKRPSGSFRNKFTSRGLTVKNSVPDIITVLDGGSNLVLGLTLPQTFFDPPKSHVIDNDSTTKGSHAVLAVGYGQYPDGELCILIRNSWGASWGNLGYAWATTKLVTQNCFTTFTLPQ